jgi:tRNA(fMet)-specific endonuclease VapC
MVILDTDHLTLFFEGGAAGVAIQRRLEALPIDDVATSVITYEEQTRGWLSFVARAKRVAEQVEAYRRLESHLEYFKELLVVGFSEAAAVTFQRLRKERLRIGTMDLRIAAIALTLDATVLTRNLRDFEKVPGLRAEDWSK